MCFESLQEIGVEPQLLRPSTQEAQRTLRLVFPGARTSDPSGIRSHSWDVPHSCTYLHDRLSDHKSGPTEGRLAKRIPLQTAPALNNWGKATGLLRNRSEATLQVTPITGLVHEATTFKYV